jgi:uncharacterized protein YcfJ
MNRRAAGALAATVVAAGALGLAGPAGAASHGKGENVATVAVSCTNGFTGSAVVRRHLDPAAMHGRWFVSHVVGGKKDAKVLVPTSIDVTFTFTATSGSTTTNTENMTKKSKAGKQTTCTLDGSQTLSSGTLTVDGSVTGAFH